MKDTDQNQQNESPSPSKKINFQYDLFESYDESDVLYNEIESVRLSLNKLRRRMFAEVDDMRKDIEALKEENLKLKFALFHEQEVEQVRKQL